MSIRRIRFNALLCGIYILQEHAICFLANFIIIICSVLDFTLLCILLYFSPFFGLIVLFLGVIAVWLLQGFCCVLSERLTPLYYPVFLQAHF